MPNVSLLPGERDIRVDDIVADTQRGVLIRNRGSWSIDHQRYNFQFSGQAFYEVRNGKIAGMLKDVAYQANTLDVLEVDGHDRRQELVLDGRRLQRRQRRAVADQLREPRLCAGPLPERQRSSTRRGAHDAGDAGSGPQQVMSRDEARALTRRVLSFSTADQTRVTVISERSGNTRFADGEHHDIGQLEQHLGDVSP